MDGHKNIHVEEEEKEKVGRYNGEAFSSIQSFFGYIIPCMVHFKQPKREKKGEREKKRADEFETYE